ncbi:DHHA1 domain-containing protein [Streptomyces netropsis]|uniref:DHHA1 domain-containing protein n=1 Tax=Streptomyces netropsis TaxID=55404 RepID=UPI0030D3C9EA
MDAARSWASYQRLAYSAKVSFPSDGSRTSPRRKPTVDIGDFSRELCGGTHVAHGSQVGAFRLLSEGSIGSNLRRIEALTGHGALRHHDVERRILEEASSLLGTRPKQAAETLHKRLGSLAAAEKEVSRRREADLRSQAQQLASSSTQVPGGRIVSQRVSGLGASDLRSLATSTADRLRSDRAVVVLGTEHDGKALLVAAITPGVLDSGTQASHILASAARTVGGGAGGAGPVANAGGRRVEALDEALSIAVQEATRALDQ